METGNHLEPGEGWGEGACEDWARLQSLLELVRRENQRTELSPERRDQLRDRVLARIERAEVRRRRVRAIVRAASAIFLAGLVLTLIVRTREA
jgi:hypothetical protein